MRQETPRLQIRSGSRFCLSKGFWGSRFGTQLKIHDLHPEKIQELGVPHVRAVHSVREQALIRTPYCNEEFQQRT